MFGIEELANQKRADIDRTIGEAGNSPDSYQALGMLLGALENIRESMASFAVENVSVDNLDEVQAALHNELSKISKPIIKAIEGLKIPSDELAKIKADVERKNVLVLDENHDIQIIRKPKQRLQIDNLSDIRFPTSFNVNNFEDLKQYFDELSQVISKTFNINVPAPQVTVNPAEVNIPEINIPETSVNIDLESVIEALNPLKYLSDRPNKPLSVRLSDGQKFIKALSVLAENQEKQVAAFSQGINANDLKKALKHVNIEKNSLSHASSNGTPITTATSTSVVSAPSAGSKLKIYRLHATNAGATATYVSWRDGASGSKYYPAYLPQNGVISLNLEGSWELTSATALYLFTSAAGSVEWHVDYATV